MDHSIFDLSGKVAVVTAAGHGLGREYCIAMAEFGADVVCNDINVAMCNETAALVEQYGRKALAIAGDASKESDVESIVQQAKNNFGKIDIVFCNAGIPNMPLRLHEMPIENWDRVMDLNVRGTFLLMRAVLPLMVEQKKGSLILTASVAGFMAGAQERSLPCATAYGASKHAVIGIMRHAAVEYAKDGIRINAIAPGAHATWPLEIDREAMERIQKKITRYIPMGRIGVPEEIRGLAVYLASDASSYVTGQVFVHDGGFTT